VISGLNRRVLIYGSAVLAVLVAGLLVFVSQLSAGSGKVDIRNVQFVPDVKAEVAGVPQSGAVIGYPDAPGLIVEYGDLRCPVCRQFDTQVFPDVINNLIKTHKARAELRLFPATDSSSNNNNSTFSEPFGYAAKQQNQLWTYALLDYANQGDETQAWFTPAVGRAFAAALGLSVPRFDSDRQSSAATGQMATWQNQAAAISAQGTPTIEVFGPGGRHAVMANVPQTWQDIANALKGVGV
jgi:protein-disulfide isomerase